MQAMLDAQTMPEKQRLFAAMTEDDRQAFGLGIVEAVELAEFSASITDWSSAFLRERLGLVVEGPRNVLQETGVTQKARSAAFELVLATSLVRAGLSPLFAVNPDLSVDYNGVTVMIQCKRPLSSKRITDNLRDARHQLRNDFVGRDMEKSVGLIAVSLSRILLHECPPDVGPFYSAVSVDAAYQCLADVLAEVANEFTLEEANEPSCSGLMFRNLSTSLRHLPALISDYRLCPAELA